MQIRSFTILVTFLTFYSFCKGQDGSDIIYYKTSALDSFFIGKEVHLDFYNRSFGGRVIDTIVVEINNKPIRFIEHRKDNGYNNWFSQQFLSSLDTLPNMRNTKIVSWVIVDITKDSIQVKPNFSFTFRQGILLDTKFSEVTFWFKKSIIKEILLKTKQYGS